MVSLLLVVPSYFFSPSFLLVVSLLFVARPTTSRMTSRRPPLWASRCPSLLLASRRFEWRRSIWGDGPEDEDEKEAGGETEGEEAAGCAGLGAAGSSSTGGYNILICSSVDTSIHRSRLCEYSCLSVDVYVRASSCVRACQDEPRHKRQRGDNHHSFFGIFELKKVYSRGRCTNSCATQNSKTKKRKHRQNNNNTLAKTHRQQTHKQTSKTKTNT